MQDLGWVSVCRYLVRVRQRQEDFQRGFAVLRQLSNPSLAWIFSKDVMMMMIMFTSINTTNNNKAKNVRLEILAYII